MKKLIVAGCITALFACNNTNEFDSTLDSKVSKPAGSDQTAVQQPGTAPASLPINAGSIPAGTQPQVVTTTPATTAQVQPQATAKGMNPPHGQSGHRCDIAVGAPLNSKPASAAATTTAAASPQNISVTPAQATTKTAPGMNPAHGQPGHRCDIAVGAPLNSKPAATPSVTTTPVTPVKTEETKPAAADQWKADIKPPAKTDSSRN